jgi:hypothetical protein
METKLHFIKPTRHVNVVSVAPKRTLPRWIPSFFLRVMVALEQYLHDFNPGCTEEVVTYRNHLITLTSAVDFIEEQKLYLEENGLKPANLYVGPRYNDELLYDVQDFPVPTKIGSNTFRGLRVTLVPHFGGVLVTP